jgi:hypothetical protein
LSSLAILLAFSSGCGTSKSAGTSTSGSGSTPSNPNSVSVSAVQPASGATNVPTTATIQISFTAAVDATTVNTTNIQVTDPNAVAGKVTYDATTNTATFTPSAALPAGASVTVTVSGVTSSSGKAMAAFTSKFTTAAPAGNSSEQYIAALYPVYKPNPTGQISVDANGNVTVQFTGGTATTTLALQFCPGFNLGINQQAPACISIGNVTTDGSGNADTTLKFPQPGEWVGDFQLAPPGGGTNLAYTTGIGASKSQTFLATLQPEKTANGGTLAQNGTQDPLSSGTVSYANGALQFTVSGAAPSTTYDILQSETRYMDSSGTYDIGEFTTDASGNGHLTLTSDTAPGGDLFEVVRHAGGGAGFGGGFSVPK